MIGSDLSEGHPVENSSLWGRVVPGPGHLRLHVNGTFVGLEADPERHLGLKGLGQFDAGAPFAQVMRPAHAGFGRRRSLRLVQDGELNRIPPILSSGRRLEHGRASTAYEDYNVASGNSSRGIS